MKKRILSALLLALCLAGLTACAPRHSAPLTFEEQQALAASAMTSEGPHNSSHPFWSSYFEMCMHRLGVTDAELKKMWY